MEKPSISACQFSFKAARSRLLSDGIMVSPFKMFHDLVKRGVSLRMDTNPGYGCLPSRLFRKLRALSRYISVSEATLCGAREVGSSS